MTVPFLKGLTSKQLLEMHFKEDTSVKPYLSSLCVFWHRCSRCMKTSILLDIWFFFKNYLSVQSLVDPCSENQTCTLGSVNNIKQSLVQEAAQKAPKKASNMLIWAIVSPTVLRIWFSCDCLYFPWAALLSQQSKEVSHLAEWKCSHRGAVCERLALGTNSS